MFENFNARFIHDTGIKNFGIGDLILGYSFELQYTSYRGTWLSCINSLQVFIDDKEIPQDHLGFVLNGKEFMIHELSELFREYWYILDYAKIKVYAEGGLPVGSSHKLYVKMGGHGSYGNYTGDGKYELRYNEATKTLPVLAEYDQICPDSPPAPKMDGIKLCCSLYSFTDPFTAHRWSVEDCVRKAAELGYEGVELVASQMVPNYPYPTDEWMDWFAGILKKYGLKMVCWSAYVDVGLRSDREQTEEEIYRFAVNDMINAKRLGAEVVRSQFGITPNVFRRMLPVCKKLGIRLAIELHNPHNPDVPIWKDLLAVMHEPGNEDGWLGVCPDFGIFQNKPHQLAIDAALRSGIAPELVHDAMQGKLRQADIMQMDDLDMGQKFSLMMLDHKAAAIPSDMKKIIGDTTYIHGKFHYMEEDNTCPAIPYDEIMPYVVGHYNGWINAEYEGHGEAPVDLSEEHLKRYKTMMDRYLYQA